MFQVKGLRNKNKNIHSETTVRDRQPRRLVGLNLDLLMCGVCMRGRGEYRGAVGTAALHQGCRYSRILRILTMPSRLKKRQCTSQEEHSMVQISRVIAGVVTLTVDTEYENETFFLVSFFWIQ